MKKNIGKCIIIISIVFALILICTSTAIAFDIYDENTPGGSPGGETGGDASGSSTKWPSPYLNDIRVRVIRNGTTINEGYFALANSQGDCYGELSDVKVCTTTGYDYDKIENVGSTASCTSAQTVKFKGCLYGNNLGNSWTRDTASSGTYLDNYLRDNSYYNLADKQRGVLSVIGYDFNNIKSGDLVIIEPVTLVFCDGAKFFGTSMQYIAGYTKNPDPKAK